MLSLNRVTSRRKRSTSFDIRVNRVFSNCTIAVSVTSYFETLFNFLLVVAITWLSVAWLFAIGALYNILHVAQCQIYSFLITPAAYRFFNSRTLFICIIKACVLTNMRSDYGETKFTDLGGALQTAFGRASSIMRDMCGWLFEGSSRWALTSARDRGWANCLVRSVISYSKADLFTYTNLTSSHDILFVSQGMQAIVD